MNWRQMESEVNSREDLIAFIYAMAVDFRKDPRKWENTSVDTYLEAVASVLEKLDSRYGGRDTDVPRHDWKGIAVILGAASIYE